MTDPNKYAYRMLFLLILVMVLCVSCTTNKNGDGKLNAMEKFFDCLGDSSKCKELKKLDD